MKQLCIKMLHHKTKQKQKTIELNHYFKIQLKSWMVMSESNHHREICFHTNQMIWFCNTYTFTLRKPT